MSKWDPTNVPPFPKKPLNVGQQWMEFKRMMEKNGWVGEKVSETVYGNGMQMAFYHNGMVALIEWGFPGDVFGEEPETQKED